MYLKVGLIDNITARSRSFTEQNLFLHEDYAGQTIASAT